MMRLPLSLHDWFVETNVVNYVEAQLTIPTVGDRCALESFGRVNGECSGVQTRKSLMAWFLLDLLYLSLLTPSHSGTTGTTGHRLIFPVSRSIRSQHGHTSQCLT
jgi:hypothetical protein